MEGNGFGLGGSLCGSARLFFFERASSRFSLGGFQACFGLGGLFRRRPVGFDRDFGCRAVRLDQTQRGAAPGPERDRA